MHKCCIGAQQGLCATVAQKLGRATPTTIESDPNLLMAYANIARRS